MTNLLLPSCVEQALAPRRFFVPAGAGLRLRHLPREQIAWEIFRGHLLDESKTRQQRTFESWTLYRTDADGSEFPLVSVRADAAAGCLHVVRFVRVYAWEPHEESPGVIATRETEKVVPELVGTIDANRLPDADALRDELAACVLASVVGVSRLAITSVESPLPDFSLGKLAYDPGPRGDELGAPNSPMHAPAELMRRSLMPSDGSTTREIGQVKLLEAALRATPPDKMPAFAESILRQSRQQRLSADELARLLRDLFNRVILSPYTHFVDNLVVLIERLAQTDAFGPERAADLVAGMLQSLCRHLTAFDLVTFHNRGANYPDALTLDALLKLYVRMIEAHPALFATADDTDSPVLRRRRRALRQACLLRRSCEGHPVPDIPTSPGENLRVLPKPFTRVPDEQIFQPETRRRHLYQDDPLDASLTDRVRKVLQQGTGDLQSSIELRELGTALYLDRPLGIFKEPGAVDRTPLLSYVAFSRSLAERRLQELQRLELIPTRDEIDARLRQLREMPVDGYPAARLPGEQRPGVVSLEDARQAAEDFVLLWTTQSSLRDFLYGFDWSPLETHAERIVRWLFSGNRVLLIRTGDGRHGKPEEPLLTAYDARMHPRLELAPVAGQDGAMRYRERRTVEYPADGLQVIAIWEEDATSGDPIRRDMRDENLVVLP